MARSALVENAVRALWASSAGYQARAYSQLALSTKAVKAGPPGRHAVSGVVATVFGCTGFTGRYMVNALARLGSRVVCPHRADELDLMHLKPMGDLGQIVLVPELSIRDEESIRAAVAKSNVVVNLIGANRETWNYSFQEVHVDAARRIAEACAAAPLVERLVHAAGEKAVLEAFPDATILRPGPVVGIEDRVFNMFANFMKMPAAPLYNGGDQRVQPVYVRDVSEAFMKVLESHDTKGKTYNLGGPNVYRLSELVDHMYREVRESNNTFVLPSFLAKALTIPRDYLAMRMPVQMMTTDYYFTTDHVDEADTDLVAQEGELGFADLNIEPRCVHEGTVIDFMRHYRVGGYDMGRLVSE